MNRPDTGAATSLNVVAFKTMAALRQEEPGLFVADQRRSDRIDRGLPTGFPVLMVETDEPNQDGGWCWAVMPEDDHLPEYWIELCKTLTEASCYCTERKYQVVETVTRATQIKRQGM